MFVPSTNPVTNSPMTPDILIRENTEDTFVYNNLIYIDNDASLNILTNNDSDLNFFRNNLYFGTVTIAHDGNDASLDQELSAKLVTDLRVTYKFTPQLRLTGIMNNAFDVYPDITNINTGTTSDGRFLYSSQVSQMGQLGRNYSLALSYKF